MIFYLIPPPVIIDLFNFNECCTSRLKLFANNMDYNDVGILEATIPGTKMDKVGHFVLRCFCLNHPEVTSYILRKETELFLHRLKQQTVIEIRKSCRSITKDLTVLHSYKEVNPLTGEKETPYQGSIILSSLESISLILMKKEVCEHYRQQCKDDCARYLVEIPFQVCLKIFKAREVGIRNGIAFIPCSKWIILLEELFVHHFNFGLTMISYSVMYEINSDSRWLAAFETLYKMYNSTKYQPILGQPHQKISHKQVDVEKRFFPPCMAHLLSVLRNNHRLTHIWRYYFSLFLKDIGLTLEESVEFWKHEYSKSCSGGTSCTHSWQKNERKYRYSIRHLYGLEGAKIEAKSKSCERIQTKLLGMRDEGGCPFVHFDDVNLMSALSSTVKQNENALAHIIQLKNEKKPCEACALHMLVSLSPIDEKKIGEEIRYESPVDYYFAAKSCMKESLNW